MANYLRPLIDVAWEAGGILKAKMGKLRKIERKTGWSNIVTEADKASEKLIIKRWRKLFPSHAILGEERGKVRGRQKSGFRLIVDPLDGTNNYTHGFPFFAVSVGLEENGMPVAGVVYAPMLKEFFYAEKGGGAYLNKKRIHVSSVRRLEKSLLATGFSYRMWTNPDDNLDNFAMMLKKAHGIRRPGAASIDLCYVACGRFDGYWELDLYPWDISAGRMIVKEAGGLVTDFTGQPYTYDRVDILASNGLIHRQMSKVLLNGTVGANR